MSRVYSVTGVFAKNGSFAGYLLEDGYQIGRVIREAGGHVDDFKVTKFYGERMKERFDDFCGDSSRSVAIDALTAGLQDEAARRFKQGKYAV